MPKDRNIRLLFFTRLCTQDTHEREGKSEKISIITSQPINHYVARGVTTFVEVLIGVRIMVYWGLYAPVK
jgi:hypothetical protein